MIETILDLPLYITTPVVLLGYSLACLGAGNLVLQLLTAGVDRIERISAGTVLATAFILGQGVLASLWMFLALAGRLSIQVVGILCFVFVVIGAYVGRNLFSGFKKQIVSIWHELRQDTWGWQLVAGLTVVLCLLWATSLGRPLVGDGPAFYFALGKLIAFSHRLTPLPGYETFTNIGLIGELHFAALMVLHSPEAAKLFSWPTISMAGIMLVSLGRATGMGRRGQWLTLSMLFSSSAVIWLSGDGKVDLFAAALGLAAFYWAVQIRFTRTKWVLFLTGLFSGFSIVAKLSYAPVIIVTIALLVLWGHATELKTKDQWRSALRSLLGGSAVILVGVVLAFIPHFVKNGLLFHNPLSPFGAGDSSWSSQVWYGPEVTRHLLLTYPLALTYGSFWAQYGNLSPLLLAFFPLMFYLPRPRPFFSSLLVLVTLIALAGIVAWILYRPSVFSPRYILAVLLLLILLPARSAEYASLREKKPRLLAAGILFSTIVTLVATGLYFFSYVFLPGNSVEYLMGAADECGRDGDTCKAINKINRTAEAGSRVYLASYQRYWFRGDLLQCLSGKQDEILDDSANEQLWLNLHENGFDFLFIDTSTHMYMLEWLDLEHVPAWVELKQIYKKAPFLVYELKFNDPPTTVQPATCQRLSSSTIWEVDPHSISNGDQEQ
jgi:hypothetical protein